jgi:hypothetical protein
MNLLIDLIFEFRLHNSVDGVLLANAHYADFGIMRVC